MSNDNPDYIAVNSSLSLLESQRQQAQQDICTLNTKKNEALANVSKFSAEFATTGAVSGAPKPQDIAPVPRISWDKYKETQDANHKEDGGGEHDKEEDDNSPKS